MGSTMVTPESDPPNLSDDRKQARKAAETTAEVAAVCAMFAVLGGAFLGAAWPGAIAACSICLMGMAVAYFQLKA
jgi:hypothetical protein